jgi:16S rRNA (cytidine1402-2'-O)-methyltransferase
VTGTLSQLAARYADTPPKGEIVMVIGPPAAHEATAEDLDSALKAALAEMSPSRAAAEVAIRLNLPKKRAYARALELSR